MKGKLISILIIFSISLLHVGDLKGHEIRPAYLELKETEAFKYEVVWKVPILNARVPNIYPIFSRPSVVSDELDERTINSLKRHYVLTFKEDPGGAELEIVNLDRTLIDVIVRLERMTGEVNIMLIHPSQPRVQVPLTTDNWQVATSFGILGIEHILFGWDHLLFVFGLMLLVGDWRNLIATITSFTLAHSITLVLSTLGHVSLPSAPVETVIALSVIFLGREYIMQLRGAQSLTAKNPWSIAFVFGLLHGFGFAGALSSIGLPEHAMAMSLFSFNVGVELGQLVFVLSLILLFVITKRLWLFKRQAFVLPLPGYIIGGIASFWFIERLLDIVA